MKIFHCWIPLSPAILSTNLLHDELECSPVVQHAHEEADEVDDGEGTEEEGKRHHPLIIDLAQDGPHGVGESVVRVIVEVGLEGFTAGQIGKYKSCPLVGVVQERPHLAAQTLNHLVTQLPSKQQI